MHRLLRDLGGRSLWGKLEAWLLESDSGAAAPVPFDPRAEAEDEQPQETGAVRDPSHFLPGHRRLRDVPTGVDT